MAKTRMPSCVPLTRTESVSAGIFAAPTGKNKEASSMASTTLRTQARGPRKATGEVGGEAPPLRGRPFVRLRRTQGKAAAISALMEMAAARGSRASVMGRPMTT